MQTAYLCEHIWGRCHLEGHWERRGDLDVAHEGWWGCRVIDLPVIKLSEDRVFAAADGRGRLQVDGRFLLSRTCEFVRIEIR
jgi:hypothetical protein